MCVSLHQFALMLRTIQRNPSPFLRLKEAYADAGFSHEEKPSGSSPVAGVGMGLVSPPFGRDP